MRGNAADVTAYRYSWDPLNGLSIERIDSATSAVFLASNPDVDQIIGSPCWLEAGAIGGWLELRLWPADEPRPASPGVQIFDATFAGGMGGAATRAASAGPASALFDDVLFKRVRLGDMNCDDEVNFDDINGFVAAVIGEGAYLEDFPDCRWGNADVNNDGSVDFDDIDAFVAYIIAAGC